MRPYMYNIAFSLGHVHSNTHPYEDKIVPYVPHFGEVLQEKAAVRIDRVRGVEDR